jgi:integrase
MLNAKQIAKLPVGMHADGANNLYLQVASPTSRVWMLRYSWHGRSQKMGLGSIKKRSLAEAREAAADAMRLVAAGQDPRAAREREQNSDGSTFSEFAEATRRELEKGFKSKAHREKWKSTLRDYCGPIARLPLSAIATNDVLAVLRPIWLRKPVMAKELRGRIERILNAAKARGLRNGDNPAAWEGNLAHLLPKQPRKVRGSHASMPCDQLPAFMQELAERDDPSARMLELTILTGGRTNEVIGMRWDELNLDKAQWTLPAERMKNQKRHVVPLVPRVVAILRDMHMLRRSDTYVFPGRDDADKPVSNMAMAELLKRMDRRDITVHGFRSTFRTWAGEETNFPREVIEHALSHIEGSVSEKAYWRGEMIKRRTELMRVWADYCLTPPAKVIKLRRRA